ncbi:hypothetical protein JMUB3935_2549 [Leptotrichia trevisanii]|jgi:hypothetical protein|uniref:Uncharacterized protein n=1 Tax=Leptotrichia trevisanii TaxID=109328 RepID=A0A510KQI4_9FUSO|nr:PD-(D/E)XK nuclease domain-containing protein [Leptotrichia trevisanii]BBM46305.1 hypothetical protein JMUB3870_2447 [Leptotrichia trevisanii]BBM53547.1 hypothetical protein JMUB3935_2549 [Leptotrichia trevisanii]
MDLGKNGELKKEDLSFDIKEALKQINEREYAKSLEYENYNVVKIGMAFWKKDVEVGIEEG